MERINKILRNKDYLEYLRQNNLAEENRIFCHHNIEHFLSVARIAQLRNLQENLQLDAEIIYSVALLHDIGRFLEVKNGTPHEIASAELAKNILFSCDYNENEVEMILQVILQHRGSKKEKTTRDCGGTKVQRLSDLMYEADKMSRNCFCCEAYEACNWTSERKNAPIVW